jgi:hypothetical protein
LPISGSRIFKKWGVGLSFKQEVHVCNISPSSKVFISSSPSVQVHHHHLRFGMMLVPVDYIVELGDHLLGALPAWLQLR